MQLTVGPYPVIIYLIFYPWLRILKNKAMLLLLPISNYYGGVYMGVFAKAYQSHLESLEKETNPKILDYWARRPSSDKKRITSSHKIHMPVKKLCINCLKAVSRIYV